MLAQSTGSPRNGSGKVTESHANTLTSASLRKRLIPGGLTVQKTRTKRRKSFRHTALTFAIDLTRWRSQPGSTNKKGRLSAANFPSEISKLGEGRGLQFDLVPRLLASYQGALYDGNLTKPDLPGGSVRPGGTLGCGT